MTNGLFSGFTQSDFSAFAERKQKAPRFNEERKIVWEKMKNLQAYLDVELKRRGFILEGKVSQYWINYTKRQVDGIWLAYTDVKPYYIVCQLNCGIYRDGFFAGIEINWKAKTHLDNVANLVKHNKDEFLSYVKKLNSKYLQISYGSWQADPNNITASDLDGLLDTLNAESEWFNLGEWYPKTESFLANTEIVPKIPVVFESLFPLYLVFAGRRPAGQKKTEKLLRIGDVRREEIVKAEKELVPEINKLTDNELDELIADIDSRNRRENTHRRAHETKTYRRNPVLSSALKQKRKDRCQVCNCSFKIDRGFFCDTHHIKPLRSGGLDVSDNILVLCPNHHRIFDRSQFEVISRNRSTLLIKIADQTFTIAL